MYVGNQWKSVEMSGNQWKSVELKGNRGECTVAIVTCETAGQLPYHDNSTAPRLEVEKVELTPVAIVLKIQVVARNDVMAKKEKNPTATRVTTYASSRACAPLPLRF